MRGSWNKFRGLYDRLRRKPEEAREVQGSELPADAGEDLSPRGIERTRRRQALVKSRPATLEQRYRVLELTELGDEVFLRLRRDVYQALDRVARTKPQPGDKGRQAGAIYRETGRLAPGRPYFYVKPPNATGLLFERLGAGWLVTAAEKIVAQDLFLREAEPLDAVVLYMARDRAVFPRVQSAAVGTELLAFAVYGQRLLSRLGIG